VVDKYAGPICLKVVVLYWPAERGIYFVVMTLYNTDKLRNYITTPGHIFSVILNYTGGYIV
jgi:hypothetical protein